jgi:hypothetical protein
MIVALAAAVGGAAIYLLALPALWRITWPYAVVFAGLGAAQLATVAAVLARPTRRRMLLATAPALAVLILWALDAPTAIMQHDAAQPARGDAGDAGCHDGAAAAR